MSNSRSQYPQKTTSCLSNGGPVRLFSSQFLWDLSDGDLIIAIPPKGPYFFISTTSLAAITRIITRLGGPDEISALSSRISKELRTYTLTVERRHLARENRIIATKRKYAKNRATWTDDEWIKFFKGVGRSKGAYQIFMTAKYKRKRNLELCKKDYWRIVKKAGFWVAPPS